MRASANLDELFAWVGFDDDDAARLRRLRPHVMADVDALADRFYATARRFPEAAHVLGDDVRQQRLRGTLRGWLDEMLGGPWDDAWRARRRRIGDAHVKVGLPSPYMLLAMNVVEFCVDKARAADVNDAVVVARAVRRIADVELAVMVGSSRVTGGAWARRVGSASARNPRCSRIFLATSGSSMQAMRRIWP